MGRSVVIYENLTPGRFMRSHFNFCTGQKKGGCQMILRIYITFVLDNIKNRPLLIVSVHFYFYELLGT